MENKICKAHIQPKMKGIMIFSIVAFILGVFVILMSYIPIREASHAGSRDYYNIFGLVTNGYSGLFEMPIRVIALCIGGIGFLFAMFAAVSNMTAKQCSLVLEQKGISGERKTMFSNKQLKLPMNKIDSISVQSGILDAVRGGKTIAVRSASGLVKFPCVQNAQEFVETTLAEIQKWEDSDSSSSVNTAPVSGNDSIESIQKLKTLLDQGLITQDEYENKRKELLDKI